MQWGAPVRSHSQHHWAGRAYLQEAVLAAKEVVLLHDGLSGQGELVLTESRFVLTWKHCLSTERIWCYICLVRERESTRRRNLLDRHKTKQLSEVLATCDSLLTNSHVKMINCLVCLRQYWVAQAGLKLTR